MNKRQAKKDRQKFVYGLIDEWNLITMDKEEQEAAQREYMEYCRKYRHYKHYHDREKILMEPCVYTYPVGKKYAEHIQKMLKTARGYHVTPVVVMQSLSDLKDQYGEIPDDRFKEMDEKQLSAGNK